MHALAGFEGSITLGSRDSLRSMDSSLDITGITDGSYAPDADEELADTASSVSVASSELRDLDHVLE